jgi:predicted GTPase
LVRQSYKRYLENRLRLSFDLQGIPVKLSFRKK